MDTFATSPELAELEQSEAKIRRHLVIAFVGLVFLISDVLVRMWFEDAETVGTLSSMAGAILMAVPILGRAIENLLKNQIRMTELVALAIIAAFAGQDYQIAGVISFFVLVSEAVERRTAMGAHKAIESIIQLTPTVARKIGDDGEEAEVPVETLSVGDIIRIRPGENVPADGTVRRGQSTLNEATITGESFPADKGPGSELFAGTTNLTGAIDIEVSRLGTETTLGKVRQLILGAQSTKSSMMQIVEHHAQWYTPTILMLAGVILFFTHDLARAISALVIACPGALVLATPTAMVAAISCAARLGILVKKAADLEFAGRLNAMIFDKTGTLTTGQLNVTRLSPLEEVTPEELVRLAASAESNSNHPTARAIARLAEEAGVAPVLVAGFEEQPGLGVSAKLEGSLVRVGRRQWLEDNQVHCAVPGIEKAESEALSLIFISKDEHCIGWIGLADRPRQEAMQAMDELNQLGIHRLLMLTGDRQSVAERVAKDLGCSEFEAECLPERKLEILEEMREEHFRVAVIGDGVNDAPALAGADLGIAMGAAGNDIAMNSASIALMNNDLSRIPFLVRLSRRTLRVVNQNLLFGVLFILAGLSLTAFGWLRPGLAAALYLASSLLVVFNSARIVRYGEELTPHDAVAAAQEASLIPSPVPA